MHRPLPLISLFAYFVLATDDINPTACYADNCARAVSGTRFGSSHLSTAFSDCSDAFVSTFFPYGSTTTIWNTGAEATATVVVPAKKRQEDEFEGMIPPYAYEACDYGEYESACSCLGVTPATTTNTASVSLVCCLLFAVWTLGVELIVNRRHKRFIGELL